MGELLKRRKKLLTEKTVSEMLNVHVKTLRNSRFLGRGPLPYVKLGSAVRYDEADVFKAVEERKVYPADQ